MDIAILSLFDTFVGSHGFGFTCLSMHVTDKEGDILTCRALVGFGYTKGLGCTLGLFWMKIL